MATESVNQPLVQKVRHAISQAVVGSDDLFVGLDELDGIEEIQIERSRACVKISLPVPSSAVRDRIRHELQEAVTRIGGIESVSVDWKPSAADPERNVDLIPDVKNVVVVSSGKGGVGKSTIATNLAVALADAGADVGLLDADVYGPNAPTLLGLSDSSPRTNRYDEMVPREGHGVKSISMDFIVEEDDPVIWRGPIVDDVLKQLFDDVAWGALDYLIVDMPPGTGDAQLSLAQHLPVTGAVVVTTPQPVATDDAERGLEMFAQYGIPILGIAENMAGFECPDCGSNHDIFGAGGAVELGERFDVPVLGRLPLDPAVQSGTDSDDDGSDRGLKIPGIGTFTLPQTRKQREQAGQTPPVTIRDEPADIRAATRVLATRVAARLNAYASETDSGSNS